jgi:ubiquinone/menaquinone biosynthesis C-methylase UbiE
MTKRVDYDAIADGYDARYEHFRFDAIEGVLHRFVEGAGGSVAEVGCGTGHWLAGLRGRVRTVAGVDASMAMLQRARRAAPFALVVHGRAEHLPWRAECFDRVFCINAMHHFTDADAFLREARRVLRPGGAILIVGRDPSTGLDAWWIHDYFPGTLEADRARYRSTAAIRRQLDAAGFSSLETGVAQWIQSALPFAEGMARGVMRRESTSQLMVIGEAEYEEGLRRLEAEQPVLRTDLRLYATIGRVPGV